MNVLSLYDGMSCGMLAMLKAGIKVDNYYAYEIDKYAIQTSQHNFPQIKQCGDVFEGDYTQYKGIDYLIGGSPCQRWSIAQSPDKRETTANGVGWELFSQYVRALHEAKPKFFIYENNKSMSKAIRESITETFGFEAICINSALVSAQNRQRLYWVGKRNADGTYSKVDVQQPEDRGILLKDVLDGFAIKEKSPCIDANYYKGGNYTNVKKQSGQRMCCAEPVNVTAEGKSQCLRATCYKDTVRNIVGNDIDKKTGVAEPVCMRYERSERAKQLRKDYESGAIKHGYHEYHELQPRTDGKTNTLSTVQKDNPICEPVRCFTLPREDGAQTKSKQYRVYETSGKPTTLCAEGGGMGAKTGLYAIPVEFNGEIPVKAISAADGKTYTVYEVKGGNITIKSKTYPIKLIDGYYIIRKLTVSECKRLQTVPEWYQFPVSDTQAYKMLGNGWTVDVIAHLIEATKTGKTVEKIEQLALF